MLSSFRPTPDDEYINKLTKLATDLNNIKIRIETAKKIIESRQKETSNSEELRYLNAALESLNKKYDKILQEVQPDCQNLQQIINKKETRLMELQKEHDAEMGFYLIEKELSNKKNGQPENNDQATKHLLKAKSINNDINKLKEIIAGLNMLYQELSDKQKGITICPKCGSSNVRCEPIQKHGDVTAWYVCECGHGWIEK